MDYKEISKELNNYNTGIITRLNDEYRISSIYRNYSNEYFSSWSWETFVWKGERVQQEYDTCLTADQVVTLHQKIYKHYIDTGEIYKGYEEE